MVFYPCGVFNSNLCFPQCFSTAIIFFGFPLLPSKLFGILIPPLEVASTLQDHCLLKPPSQSQTSFKWSSQPYQISWFRQVSILSLRKGVSDILAHWHRPKLNFTLCIVQVNKVGLKPTTYYTLTAPSNSRWVWDQLKVVNQSRKMSLRM